MFPSLPVFQSITGRATCIIGLKIEHIGSEKKAKKSKENKTKQGGVVIDQNISRDRVRPPRTIMKWQRRELESELVK
jgi:retron-type reverse transcriptase